MTLQILFLILHTALVTTNPVTPVISSQTYPIYEQNGYVNPAVNQPTDITSYLQGMTVQNQLPQFNSSPTSIRQILLNRILSSPSVQTTLNKNLMSYGSNLAELSNSQMPSNLVNNYYAIPTEYLIHNTTETRKDDNATDSKTKKKHKQSNRRRSSKSRRKHDSSENNHTNSNKNIREHDDHSTNINKTGETNKKSRKRSRNKQNTELPEGNEKNKSDKKIKTRKRKVKDVQTYNDAAHEQSINEKIPVENSKPKRRRRKQKIDKDKTEKEISEQETMPNLTTNEIIEGINMVNLNEGVTEENRVPRNSYHEENDLLNPIPNTPEDIAKSFLTSNSKMFPQFNNPMISNFLANYENIYQSMMSSKMEMNDKREKNQKSRRIRKHHRRKKGQKSKTLTEETTRPAISNFSDMATTERTVYFKVKIKTNTNTTPRSKDLESFAEVIETEEKMINTSNNEEFGDVYHENIAQNINANINNLDTTNNRDFIYDGFINDYYPLFTDSAAHNANNKEVYIKNLGEHNYYYATDKEHSDFISKQKFEEYDFSDHIIKDYELNKQYKDIEMNGMGSSSENGFESKAYEEVKFRSPPLLESPDFQTRKIEKGEIYPEPYLHIYKDEGSSQRFVGDKSPSYFEAKPLYYTGKQNGIKSEYKENNPKAVETVFARSKVVNYGPVYSPEDGNSATGTRDPAEQDDAYFKDGETCYVLAEPLDFKKWQEEEMNMA